MGSEVSQITKNIWLSGRQVLAHHEVLPTTIDVVITIMLEEEVRDYGIEGLVKKMDGEPAWHWFAADDSEDEEIYRHFFGAHTILKAAEAEGKQVLVHCAGGISRSPTLVIAHLMQACGWTRDEALTFVKKRREWVEPNEGFMRQLNMLERFLRNQ
jgi:hypothetical protein